MTNEIALVLFILGVAIVLFASERIRVDVVSMMVLLTLLLTGLVTVEEAFSGFSSPAVITVWAIYIVSASLTYTGIADYIGNQIGKIPGIQQEARLILAIMVAVGTMSAFMNNIGATAVLLPVVIGLGKQAKISSSKLLIPLAFGSLIGGVTTLIGTPPNLLASNALFEAGYAPFTLFDYTPMGLIIMISGIFYFVTVGRHLLPSHEQSTHPETTDLTSEYQIYDYLAELRVDERSTLVGKTIADTHLGEMYDITVMGLLRNNQTVLGILPNAHIQIDDILLIKGGEEQFLQVHAEVGLSLLPRQLRDQDLKSPEATMAEIIVSQKAHFIGSTLSEIDFRNRYGLSVLAIWREEAPLSGPLAAEPLRMGDTLLVQGRRERIEALRDDISFLLLRPPDELPRRLNKAPLNLIIFLSMIGLVTMGILHISVAAVLAAILMVLTKCLDMDEAYEAVEWKSVFLIAGMLPMGIAMENTGTAQFLADLIINTVGDYGPQAIMIGLFVLTTIITEFMSNAAAAVLVAPIAIGAAVGLNVDPRAFVMGVGIAASNSFMFPIGHQASVLVYGPGGYRFFDYTKVGLPLTIIIWILMIIFLPLFWPLRP
ncbi:MAG: SLC13 family permease [Anaerolineales bacterium]|nr:SLC13 family permease [Anaerolineales bacterium]